MPTIQDMNAAAGTFSDTTTEANILAMLQAAGGDTSAAARIAQEVNSGSRSMANVNYWVPQTGTLIANQEAQAAASSGVSTTASAPLENAIQKIINRLTLQGETEKARSEEIAALEERGFNELVERTMAEYGLGKDAATDKVNQTIERSGLTRSQILEAAGINREQTISGAGLTRDHAIGRAGLNADQTIARALLQMDQTVEGAGLNRDQKLERLLDAYTRSITGINEGEKVAIRGVINNALDRGVYRSGIREFNQSEVERLAEQERGFETTDYNRETGDAGEIFGLAQSQAQELYGLTSQQAQALFSLTSSQANAIFGETQKNALQTEAYERGRAIENDIYNQKTALSDYENLLAELEQDRKNAQQKGQLQLDQTLATMRQQLERTVSQLEISAASKEAELKRVQQETQMLQAQSLAAPTTGSGTSGTSGTGGTSGGGIPAPAVTSPIPIVPSGGDRIDTLRSIAGVPGYEDYISQAAAQVAYSPPVYNVPDPASVDYFSTAEYQALLAERKAAAGIQGYGDNTVAPTYSSSIVPDVTYTPPTYDAGPAVQENFDYVAPANFTPITTYVNQTPKYDPTASVQTQDYQDLINERRRVAGVI